MSKEQMQEEQQEEQQPPTIDPKEYESLKDRLTKLEANNKELLAEKKEAWDRAEKARMEAAKKGGDVEALEKSWQEKLNAMIAEKDAEASQYKQMVTGLTVGATAIRLAAEVFGDHADLMMPHVNSRLSTEITEGKPKVRVLDTEGKPTAMSIQDLAKEFRDNPKFAPFVIGSRSSGGAPHGTGKGVGAQTMTRSSFDALSPKQRAEFARGGGRLIDG